MGSLDIYHIHPDFGRYESTLSESHKARQTLTHNQDPEKYLFFKPQSLLTAAVSENI